MPHVMDPGRADCYCIPVAGPQWIAKQALNNPGLCCGYSQTLAPGKAAEARHAAYA